MEFKPPKNTKELLSWAYVQIWDALSNASSGAPGNLFVPQKKTKPDELVGMETDDGVFVRFAFDPKARAFRGRTVIARHVADPYQEEVVGNLNQRTAVGTFTLEPSPQGKGNDVVWTWTGKLDDLTKLEFHTVVKHFWTFSTEALDAAAELSRAT